MYDIVIVELYPSGTFCTFLPHQLQKLPYSSNVHSLKCHWNLFSRCTSWPIAHQISRLNLLISLIPEKSDPCQYIWHFQQKRWSSHLLVALLDSEIQNSLEYCCLGTYITRIKGLFQATDWLLSLICRKRSRRANTYSWCAFSSLLPIWYFKLLLYKGKSRMEKFLS